MADKDTFYDLACEYVRQQRYDEAIALFQALLRERPDEDSLRLALAWAYRDSGRTSEAIVLFEQLLETELSRNVFSGFAFDELVRIHTAQGDFSTLVAVCEKVVKAQPDDLSLAVTLGRAYLRARRSSEAIGVFERLCRLEPDATLYWLSLGDALIASGAHDRALEAYERAIATDPAGADGYHFRLGQAMLQAGDYDGAGKAFERAIDENPGCALYYCSAGDVCLKLGLIAQAESAYEEACRVSPNDYASFYNRFGHALMAVGRPADAVRAFRRAVRMEPDNALLQVHLDRALAAAGLTNGTG